MKGQYADSITETDSTGFSAPDCQFFASAQATGYATDSLCQVQPQELLQCNSAQLVTKRQSLSTRALTGTREDEPGVRGDETRKV